MCVLFPQGFRVPFLGVAHDGWDGKRKLIFGVSIFFIHPGSLDMYRIPIGLAQHLELSEATMNIVKRCGGEASDVFRPINDNCNIAVATGRK